MRRIAKQGVPANVLLIAAVGVASIFGLWGVGLGCSGDDGPEVELSTGGTGQGGTLLGGGGSGGTGGTGAGGEAPTHFADFPEEPVVEDGLPSDIADLFAGATGSDTGGPCLAEPTLDAMVPSNWTPLYFQWQAPTEQNVFELRLEVENQLHDLVVYTTQPSFAMTRVIWTSFSDHSAGQDVEITLRGATLEGGALTAGPLLGASGAIHIAPVPAPGSVVYWAASGGTSFDGFMIGDDAPVTVLTPTSAGTTSTGGSTTCISCHASSPDGELIIYTRDADDATRSIDVRMVDGSGGPAASVITPTALNLLGRHKQAAPLLSSAHYEAGDAVALAIFFDATLTAGQNEIIWTDLEADDMNDWGILARTGDARQASSPQWSRDGATVAYVSSDTAGEGVIANGACDIYTVPFNNRAGGSATPLAGASDAAYDEYYPVYSPNDAWIAFNRHDQGTGSYNIPEAEVFVVPGAGGTAVRLRANDPPACTGLTSPGLTNSWPRWAPTADEHDGLRYYWLVFSSKRRAAESAPTAPPIPQLYIAAVVTSEQGGVETIVEDYPALYVRSQNPDENNHTPAWENFVVDQVPR
ncbi:MAG: hypothetical protein JRI23_09675 [Deltaproteobacteria bacterium]|jgi:hypothetical protein|nr:hypothetical protein [Deltaproteobacteria bacterium]MBW2531924.1 hypothetical protein [Deltaproteobacteria bacterium]